MAGSQQQRDILKRKAPKDAGLDRSEHEKKPKKRAKKCAAQTPPLPFLHLPAELRNSIYSMAAETHTAYLRKGRVTDRSNLTRINHQIRAEYLPILLLCAAHIRTEVFDFDFRHLVTFINRLSAAEHSALPSLHKPATRTIEVTLYLRPVHPHSPVDAGLPRRWLKRAGHATKKGTALDFSYALHTPPGFTETPFTCYPWWHSLSKWKRALAGFIDVAEEGRTKEEAGKISKALG